MELSKIHLSIINLLLAIVTVYVYGSTSPLILKGAFIGIYFLSLWVLITLKKVKITSEKEEMAEFEFKEGDS